MVAAAVLTGSAVASSKSQADSNNNNDDRNNNRNNNDHHNNGARCFLAGTRIKTPDGEVEIERLRIGDFVMTLSGDAKPIKWIGRMTFTREASETWSADIAPVKIARFALDAKTPHTDLCLSGAHAVYLRGALIPVRHLVNGISITADNHSEASVLAYYHIELSGHDVIFAEGAPTETYQASAYTRPFFDNAGEYTRLYGADLSMMAPFAPILSLNGGRQELLSRLRSVGAPIYDMRKPLDLIRDEIADRAERKLAA